MSKSKKYRDIIKEKIERYKWKKKLIDISERKNWYINIKYNWKEIIGKKFILYLEFNYFSER